jgi:hypothetical protein
MNERSVIDIPFPIMIYKTISSHYWNYYLVIFTNGQLRDALYSWLITAVRFLKVSFANLLIDNTADVV